MHSKRSHNKTKQIKCNDINKNILPPNNGSSSELWLQTKWLPSNTQTQKHKQRGVFVEYFTTASNAPHPIRIKDQNYPFYNHTFADP